MPSTNDLPYMIALADDPSEAVQLSLGEGFSAFGNDLDTLLTALDPPATHEQRQRARTLSHDYRRAWLREQWSSWFAIEGERDRLEAALCLITGFQDGPHHAAEPSAMLDALASDFFNTLGEHNPLTLAHYLFQTRALTGAEPDYWLPQNSNLRYTLTARRGIPITLAAVYVLVATRLGYEVTACNWPNHFLATCVHNGQRSVIDCFRGGQAMDAERFLAMQGPSRAAARVQLEEDATAETIMARVLKNLVRQYHYIEHFANAQLMVELLKDLERNKSAGTPG